MSRDSLPLVRTLNQLLKRMSVTISRERRFISDGAHELRTPLTASKTRLQVARITHGKKTEVELDNAEEGVTRLQRTLTQLLTLSQVEEPFPRMAEESRTPTKLRVWLFAMRLPMRTNATHRIALHGGANSAELSLPQALAVTALRNLFDNALRHSSEKNSVRLELRSL